MSNRILALLLALLLVGCTSPAAPDASAGVSGKEAAEEAAGGDTAGNGNSEAGKPLEEADHAEDASEQGSADSDEQEDVVVVVIPTVYENVTTQEEADRIRDENGYLSAELQEDNSLKITMTREQHRKMLEEFKESVDQAILDITTSENYPTVEKIEYNDEYSMFTVTVNSDEIGIVERQLAEELIMYGTFYHVCSGNDVENIHVDYISKESGEVLESADSGSLESAY